mmetsp:Transcript_20296/g.61150  ORF Transcript_20296/g.61150 Transcript_20296/m.61150 type:complete len:340 (-) Transcript_20296:668-1687(-)|eukprot:CAMPEP_0206139886 /NCGR_PEP_ID=MMETSP1473-20131121/7629_1 /ASSEMBLY_ACC=CAM_ASM_001109 /TAXON_ID=1461547 /ORGANISM="Stichococcus sp, Strain RCC1054" /LENGTH=339 /DNA_ID=CAMNT_0053533815 /DNA_START=155 /DNA_END=1174 /DNA_ORIENTATION=+
MAFRAAITRGTAAAGVAGAGFASIPAVAECRAPALAHHPAGVPSNSKSLEHIEHTEKRAKNSLEEPWVSTNVLCGGDFAFDEVEEAVHDVLGSGGGMQDVLAIANGRVSPDVCGAASSRAPSPVLASFPGSPQALSEDSGEDSDSVASFGADADRSIASPWETSASGAGSQLTATMHALLNNREVQLAVSRALQGSPEFESLLLLSDPEDAPLYTAPLLPPAAAAAHYERCPEGRENVLEKALQVALSGLTALGESLVGMGGGLATFFTDLASDLRAALHGGEGRATPKLQGAAGANGEGRPGGEKRRALWKGAIFSLAIAVFAVVVLKRHRVVRFHRA